MSSMRVHAEVLAEVDHAAGFQLEHGDRLAAVQQVEGGLVIERDGVEMLKSGRVLVDQLHGVVDDGERLQAEEVHLQHAQFGQRTHGELGDDFVRVAPREREVVGEILRRR